MKLETTNPNYCATVVKVNDSHPLEGCDNLLGINIFGYNIIAHKSINLDGLHILFTTETRIDDEFLFKNNLYSSSSMNEDITIKGYIGKNGRVKAIRLRGHSSNAMLMPIDSLSSIGVNVSKLKEGDTFNEIDGKEICKKYELPVTTTNGQNKVKGLTKRYERIDGKHFPEHFNTEQYLRNDFKYGYDDNLIITQKLHGTSVRLGYVETKIKPTLMDKMLRRQRTEYDYLAGSRRVIKDLKSDRVFQHYYETHPGELDIYNKALLKIKDKIPKDVIMYGELVGYNGSSPIQKGYTYGEKEGEFELYIYRIVSINKDGITFDWGRDNIRDFCNINGLKYTPELTRCKKYSLDVQEYLDVNYSEALDGHTDFPIPVQSDLVDEGICIRKEGVNPYVTKVKSPIFYEYETKLLDEGTEVAG